MSRLPAALLYLTVYNPTIKPVLPDDQADDEDAEEQAQILFYTARERAVSRDRMLRQVGLAKALINFTEVFNAGGRSCENVHSQTRRMVMVSPEPDYWIHACVELPKTPRTIVPKGKKKTEKGKEPEILYDYHDGAIHDEALRAHILRGYEQFKLTHGSFTSIMRSIGQQALELQLERFFTVWAWMWDIEDAVDFGDHLGFPLHPAYKSLAPCFDSMYPSIPMDAIPFLVSPPSLIPSVRFTALRTPPSLPQHLLSILPSAGPKNIEPETVARAGPDSETIKATTSKQTGDGDPPASGFLVMPNVAMPAMTIPNVNLNMDLRKWTWPGYLTFGKAGNRAPKPSKSLGDEKAIPDVPPASEPPAGVAEPQVNVSVEVDAQSLEDAITSGTVPPSRDEPAEAAASPETDLPAPSRTPPVEEVAVPPDAAAIDAAGDDSRCAPESAETNPVSEESISSAEHNAAEDIAVQEPILLEENPRSEEPRPEQEDCASAAGLTQSEDPPSLPAEPLPKLLRTQIHLSDPDDPLLTKKRRMFYLTKNDLTFAFVDGVDSSINEEDLSSLTEIMVKLIDDVVLVLAEEERRSGTETPVTAAKILQPKDSYVFALGDTTLPSSDGFKSASEHLYNGQQLLQSDSVNDIVEVFSRGLTPQHWYVSRRGLGSDKDGSTVDGEVYLQSSRKESSLADVDNEIAAAVRRFIK